MRRFDLLTAAAACLYLILAAAVLALSGGREQKRDGFYLAEVNMVMSRLEEKAAYEEPDLSGMDRIRAVSWLDAECAVSEDPVEAERIRSFFRRTNGMDRHVEPLMPDGRLLGFVGFDYEQPDGSYGHIIFMEGVILLSGLILLSGMLYVRFGILAPFQRLSRMPYELSKGHLNMELEENRSRFFGKFVWGISMLRDSLRAARAKELKLEREKKLLLLSVSHDIKTPLNSIKLYAKALSEGIYETEEERREAAGHIASLSLEIESFVREIIKNSSEDILSIEVENSEFYLSEYVETVRAAYEPKCRLRMTELSIGAYSDRLLKGDRDSAFEVMENLLENALKYGDGRLITISFYEEDYCQLIKIYNTGSTVSVGELPHLFDSFYRGSNASGREGNGLGLYICREVMRRMDGEIFAGREKDGMSFTLVFR